MTQMAVFSLTGCAVYCKRSASSASIYFGVSYAVDSNGDIIVELPLREKAVADAETDLNYLREIREKRPLLQNEL